MGEQWSSSQEEEEVYRRSLFRKARKGDVKAKDELENVYGVKLWSEQERSRLAYDNPKFKGKGGPAKKK